MTNSAADKNAIEKQGVTNSRESDVTVKAKQRSSNRKPKTINLALQGGGAHGAFTWGVLDKLLADGRIHIEAISGTSAGAMNAAVLADGMVTDGVDGAREALKRFWHAVSEVGKSSPIKRTPWDVMFGIWDLDRSPSFLYFDLLSRFSSPYELNPFNINFLRHLVEREIDFERVVQCSEIKLFISATNVHTGRVKVFAGDTINSDVIMASACLPHLFQAVEIDGVPYWDGGFMGNPVLFPFYKHTDCKDIVLVQVNPLERNTTPKTARDILNRVNEITFNSSLMKELRAIHFVSRLIDRGKLDRKEYKKINLHRIDGGEALLAMSATSKLNAEWVYLKKLRDIGRDAAQIWLDDNLNHVGKSSSLDLKAFFAD